MSVPGIGGSANTGFYFDTSASDYILMPYDSTAYTDWSVSFWFKTSGATN